MNAAFEVSPDDPQGLAEAIQHAAQGAVVHLVRDGQAVADIVPAASAQAAKAGCNERALAFERRQAERFGAPTLADYRKVYQTGRWLGRLRLPPTGAGPGRLRHVDPALEIDPL